MGNYIRAGDGSWLPDHYFRGFLDVGRFFLAGTNGFSKTAAAGCRMTKQPVGTIPVGFDEILVLLVSS